MDRPSWMALAAALLLAWIAVCLGQGGAATSAHTAAVPPPGDRSRLPPVRVLLGSPARRTLKLEVAGPYRITQAGTWRVLAQGSKLPPGTVSATADGLHLAERTFAVGELEIEPVGPATLWVDDTCYRGTLRIRLAPHQRMAAVNVVELEDYIASVVHSEMPARFPLEARRAQAIAARSFALYQMKRADAARRWDLSDGAGAQQYRGVCYRTGDRVLAVETDESRRAAQDTAGLVVLYQGRLICTYYGAVCGGQTAPGSQIFSDAAPPLVSLGCPHCAAAPNASWEVRISRDTLRQAMEPLLRARGKAPADWLEFSTAADDQPQGLPQVVVRTPDGPVTLSAYDVYLRAARLGLKSPRFSAQQEGNTVRFRGRGWGHTVGLCQWGAARLAAEGRGAADILRYYYPTSQLGMVR